MWQNCLNSKFLKWEYRVSWVFYDLRNDKTLKWLYFSKLKRVICEMKVFSKSCVIGLLLLASLKSCEMETQKSFVMILIRCVREAAGTTFLRDEVCECHHFFLNNKFFPSFQIYSKCFFTQHQLLSDDKNDINKTALVNLLSKTHSQTDVSLQIKWQNNSENSNFRSSK